MTVASEFLGRLLKQAERAEARHATPLRLPLSQAKCPAYYAMRDLQDAEAFRGELQAAVHAGAITVELQRGGTWPRDVAAIALQDLDKLSEHLGASLLRDRMTIARTLLAPHIPAHPVVARVLDAWAAGKTVRRAGPDRADALVQAIRVVDARRGAHDDALIRRESIRLFGRSKRIEALVPWIAVVNFDDLLPSGLTPTEVLASLGLIRESQPFVIAGTGHAQVEDTAVALARPYLGLPVEAVSAFNVRKSPQFLLSVENKQTFHELARLSAARRAILVYTGGMPSPAWLRAYRLLLAAVPLQTPCFHFGDLDLGGFRIAGRIVQAASSEGRALRPWRMDPSAYLGHGIELNSVTEARALAIQAAATSAGWNEIAEAIAANPGQAEQEALPASLPE